MTTEQSTRTYSILVVDDEPLIREMLTLMLEAAGHQVTSVPDGRMALEAAANQSFDLVITDVVMPEKDGLELIRELNAKNTPARIIAMSAGGHLSSKEYLKMAKIFGASTVLPKPFDKRRLFAAVAGAFTN